jgi:demethylspheroidene O-methyltransferase
MNQRASLTAPASHSGARPLAVRLRNWRNQIIRNPRFQALCTKIPGLRGMAQGKANALYALTAGFVYSQIFHATVSSGLLAALRDGALDIATIERHIGLGADGTRRLLSAAQSVGLITQPTPGFWALDDLGAVAAHDDGILAMVRHHGLLYGDLADPLALLKTRSRQTAIARLWAYSANPEPGSIDPEDGRIYSELMRVSQDAVAAQVLDAHDFSSAREIVDVGGGHGRFLAKLAARNPAPRLHLFDLPPVAEQGLAALHAAGLGPRSIATGGSFFSDPVPGGADCYTLVRVLYDHDDAAALSILKNVRAAMTKGATLVIAEPMGGHDGPQALVNAYFSLYLVAMASGRCRSADELCAMARAAGFSAAHEKSTRQPLYTGLVIATA